MAPPIWTPTIIFNHLPLFSHIFTISGGQFLHLNQFPHISGYLIHNQSTTYPPWTVGYLLHMAIFMLVSCPFKHPIHLYLSSWGSLSIWKPMGFIIISLMISLQVPSGWWYTYPSEKYESQLGWLFPKYEKIKHVPHHQPAINKLGSLNHSNPQHSLGCA